MNYALLFYTNSGALRELHKALLVGAQNYMIDGYSFIPIFLKTNLEKSCCDLFFLTFSMIIAEKVKVKEKHLIILSNMCYLC